MYATESNILHLLKSQHPDGGWGYRYNNVWTEPTCYAILALRSARSGMPAIRRAQEWLLKHQRDDGGWAPHPSVDQSGGVTSLAVLALFGNPEFREAAERGVVWLLKQTGAESSTFEKILRTLTGNRSAATDYSAWPWFPGSAAWVTPTSLAILALSKYVDSPQRKAIEDRIHDGRQFLLARRCPDYGWNHGGTSRKGENAFSYPETTGIALLALSGVQDPSLQRSIARAETLYSSAKSAEGLSWLHLGLKAHGRKPMPPPDYFRDWTTNDVCLRAIAECADAGRNPFFDYV